MSGATPDPSEPAREPDAISRLQLSQALQRAKYAIAWERSWPHLARLLTVAGLFLVVSWAGLWLALPFVARAVGLGLFALAALGAVYQQIGSALDARLAPPPGEMVAVNGHAVHLFCTGSGARTYLLDAGAGGGVFEWWRLQPLLAKTGRVCAFDRSGLGWSDPSGGELSYDRNYYLISVGWTHAGTRTPLGLT